MNRTETFAIQRESETLPESSRKSIAIFDLDGTLTDKDSFLAYLISFGIKHRKWSAFIKMPFLIAAYLIKIIKDFQLKQYLIADFLEGVPREIITQHTDWFCKEWLPKHLHPVGINYLHSHQAKGDRIILLSASPSVYVPAVAEALKINEVVCTQIKSDKNGWRGHIEGMNCKGKEKRRVMQAYLNTEQAPPGTHAYGDSKSDKYILDWVCRGIKI